LLLVNARVGPSQVHGLGLIAMEFIPSGTIVWKHCPRFDLALTSEDLQALSPAARQQILHYCDGDLDSETGTYTLSIDDARFTNHSDHPNTVSADEGRITIAVRDIAVGEEITWKYHSIREGSTVHKPDHFEREPAQSTQENILKKAAGQQILSWLTEKVDVRPTKNRGSGIFATSIIDRDEPIAVFGGHIVPLKHYNDIASDCQDWSIQIADNLLLTYITHEEKGSLTDFVNHSCSPNAGWRGMIELVAMRVINPGEEITFDYATCLAFDFGQMECLCGAANCRGIVTGEDWKRDDVQTNSRGYLQPFLQRKLVREDSNPGADERKRKTECDSE